MFLISSLQYLLILFAKIHHAFFQCHALMVLHCIKCISLKVSTEAARFRSVKAKLYNDVSLTFLKVKNLGNVLLLSLSLVYCLTFCTH